MNKEGTSVHRRVCINKYSLNLSPNKLCFLCVRSTSLLKTPWEKAKSLVRTTSPFIIVIVLCPSCGVTLDGRQYVVNFLPCVRDSGQTFGPILLKLGQNVCHDEISDDSENRSCRVKLSDYFENRSEKYCVRSRC